MGPMIDVTWLNAVIAVVVLYYFFLYGHLTSRRLRRKTIDEPCYHPFVFVVIPAHNEEAVIAHTIESLLKQDYPDRAILVMNDGSQDRTSEIARRYTDQGVMVVDRGLEIAGQGKGEVLNHAFGIINELVDTGDPRLGGRGADDIVIAITDADGQLERATLTSVVPYFAAPNVGGVQIGVRIANADANTLTRMQDVEFIGFSAFVQEARDAFGSVGLGGNGQFTRLSALRDTGAKPWSRCLTEDLDLGLTLVRAGWRIRFCPTAYVAQQGVTNLRVLMRQRTRWIQGHYQCWQHIPGLATDKAVPLKTRADLLVYLVMVIFIVLVAFGMATSIIALTGAISVSTSFLAWIEIDSLRNAVRLVLSFGPMCMFLLTYQQRSADPVPGRWLPAIALLFAFYTYMWIVAQVWAWIRLATGTGAWVKTPRVQSEAVV